jgi:hypothetical protein
MRIRSILPKFYESEDIGAMDWNTRLVFIGLWSYADDNGVGRDVPSLIAADLFPYDLSRDSRDTLARVADALQTLSIGGQITRYTIDKKPLYFIVKWDEYQRVDRPAKPRYERPTSTNAEIRESLARVSRDSRDTLATGEGEKGRRGEGEKDETTSRSRSPRGSPINADWRPSDKCHDDLGAEYIDLNLPLELDAFRDHWLSKGEIRKDWDAAFRNWCRNARKYNTRAAPSMKRTNGLSDSDWQAAFERAQAKDLADAMKGRAL